MFSISQVEEVEYFRPGCLGKIQKCMWDMFEKPHTSFGAKVTQTFLLDNLPFLLCSVEFFLIYLSNKKKRRYIFKMDNVK